MITLKLCLALSGFFSFLANGWNTPPFSSSSSSSSTNSFIVNHNHNSPMTIIIKDQQNDPSAKRNISEDEEDDELVSSCLLPKKLLCVRHGISVANEFMLQPGNQWGDATFRDDPTLIDAPLSEQGRLKTQTVLPRQLRTEYSDFLKTVELVIVSPLTRCLETYQYGVEQELQTHNPLSFDSIPILAVPLLRERVYTISDTGRPASVLAKEFPTVDFSQLWNSEKKEKDDNDNVPWWYTEEYPESEEWRPYGQGQWYAVPGEPMEVFEKRMQQLDEWIWKRKERIILMVAHWGVLRHLTSGTEWDNAEARLLEWSFCPIRNGTVVAHL